MVFPWPPAKTEAAELARRLNRHRDGGRKEIRILGAFAHGLAEAGQFERAVTAQREVVDIYHATEGPAGYPSPDGVVWSLLDLAERADVSLETEREAIQIKHRMAEAEPRCLPGLVIWLAGVSSRFTDAGHPQEAGELLRRPSPPVATCRPKAIAGTSDSIRPSMPRCSPGPVPETSGVSTAGRSRSASAKSPHLPSSRSWSSSANRFR